MLIMAHVYVHHSLSTRCPALLQELFVRVGRQGAGVADVVSLGDSWLGPAIAHGVLQHIPNATTYRYTDAHNYLAC